MVMIFGVLNQLWLSVVRKDSINVFLILFRRKDFLCLCLLEGDRNKYCLLVKDKKKGLEVNQKET